MRHLLRSLPDPNLITFLFLLEHLKRYPRASRGGGGTARTMQPLPDQPRRPSQSLSVPDTAGGWEPGSRVARLTAELGACAPRT